MNSEKLFLVVTYVREKGYVVFDGNLNNVLDINEIPDLSLISIMMSEL